MSSRERTWTIQAIHVRIVIGALFVLVAVFLEGRGER
jgi:hypothetical protein